MFLNTLTTLVNVDVSDIVMINHVLSDYHERMKDGIRSFYVVVFVYHFSGTQYSRVCRCSVYVFEYTNYIGNSFFAEFYRFLRFIVQTYLIWVAYFFCSLAR